MILVGILSPQMIADGGVVFHSGECSPQVKFGFSPAVSEGSQMVEIASNWGDFLKFGGIFNGRRRAMLQGGYRECPAQL